MSEKSPRQTPTVADLARHRGQPVGESPRPPEAEAATHVKGRHESDQDVLNRLIAMDTLRRAKEQELLEFNRREATLNVEFQKQLLALVEKKGDPNLALDLNERVPDIFFRLENDCIIAVTCARLGWLDFANKILKRSVESSDHPDAPRLLENARRAIQDISESAEEKVA